MIEVLNIQATHKDGRVINYKEVRMIPTLQDKLNITDLHDKLKYATIESRIDRINKGRVDKIRLDTAYKTIYVFSVEHDAYLFYAKYLDKSDLVYTINTKLLGKIF